MGNKLDLNKLRQSEFYDYARVSWMRGASMFKYVPSREALEVSIAVHRLAEKNARRLLEKAEPGSEEAQELAYTATWLGNFAAWMAENRAALVCALKTDEALNRITKEEFQLSAALADAHGPNATAGDQQQTKQRNENEHQ